MATRAGSNKFHNYVFSIPSALGKVNEAENWQKTENYLTFSFILLF
jgi:hypothetical protein